MAAFRCYLTYGNRTVRVKCRSFCDLQEQAAQIFTLELTSAVRFRLICGEYVHDDETLRLVAGQSTEDIQLVVTEEDVKQDEKSSNNENPTSKNHDNLQPNETKNSGYNKAVKGALLGGPTFAVAAPLAVEAGVGVLGFGAGGIVAESTAASMMSASAIASGGGVTAGSTVAVLQSIAAAGLGPAGIAISAAVGLGTGAALGVWAAAILEKISKEYSKEEESKDVQHRHAKQN